MNSAAAATAHEEFVPRLDPGLERRRRGGQLAPVALSVPMDDKPSPSSTGASRARNPLDAALSQRLHDFMEKLWQLHSTDGGWIAARLLSAPLPGIPSPPNLAD